MRPPAFASVGEYAARFTDVEYWRPFIEAVCERHGLQPGEIRAGMPGSHPVFMMGERFVLKFFTHFFSGEESWSRERAIYGLLEERPSIPAPKLIAEGSLFLENSEGWHWPYLLSTRLPGRSLREDCDTVSDAELRLLVPFLANALREIHALPCEGPPFLPTWKPFLSFLEKQRAAWEGGSIGHRSLSPHLQAQVMSYLPPLETLVDTSRPPQLLHCDMNHDHLLGVRRDGRWTPTGIIDFGDARVGDRMYEWVALYLGLFLGNKCLLRDFLMRYGEDVSHPKEFAHRAMTFTLLHEFDVLEDFKAKMNDVSTLEELAARLWNPEEPGFEP